MGAAFPDSFLAAVDRLILAMHPKYKKKKKKVKSTKKGGTAQDEGNMDEEKARQARLFPGLSMPDQEWAPTTQYQGGEKDKGKAVDLGEVDDLMAELEGVNKRAAAEDDREAKRPRDGRSRSPERRRGRSPDYERGGGDGRGGYGRRDEDRGRDGYGGRGADGRVGPKRVDDAPVMYKVYPGKVASMKDFGAFVSLEGVAGLHEGTLFRLALAAPSHS